MDYDLKVISFDLDGVLYDGKSATYPVAKELGLEQEFFRIIEENIELQRSNEDSIIEVAKIWTGVPVDGTLDHIIKDMPLMSGAEETVSNLKDWGYEVGCISSGVSQYFLIPLVKRLELDFAFSNILGEKDGKHDGTVSYAMGGPQKAETALKYLSERGFSRENLAAIGNGENDIDLFRRCKLSIAFNPVSELVSEVASLTIHSKDLRSVLPHFFKDI
ncbi:MAG: HAD hydrolase family protein [Candidatus Thorarchaeota archaeon]|nr:HAD hydrolase family protein [Candidatus Thorarchaeota archaeon]MCK5239900.1 HAD hydrolase family protein [Candidatus Thorarchaeota archaeon]